MLIPDGHSDPIELFKELFATARASETTDISACALASATPDGRPAVRMVLLKGVDGRGFSFFTNYESRKGRELLANPHAAMCFLWPRLEVQVRIEGTVEPLDAAESDAYFRTRPRESQLGAWASDQSRPIDDRAVLLERFHEAERRFLDQPVPRPPHWGGFLIRPHAIEFWAGQPGRLHDRVLYRRAGSQPTTAPAVWNSTRLFP